MIAARNEIEGMKVILPRIQKEWVDEILVIDGGSTDGSVDYAKSLGLTVIRQKSKGLQNAYWEGLEVAQGDVIIPFSPDGNSVPERIPDLVRKMKEGYDMVIVSRYFKGTHSEDDSLLSGWGNWLFTRLINLLFGSHYTDTLVMYRAWKKDLIKVFQGRPSIAGFEPELCILCAKGGFRTAEIPGPEPKRIGGESKAKRFSAAFAILALILREWVTPVRTKAPLPSIPEKNPTAVSVPKP